MTERGLVKVHSSNETATFLRPWFVTDTFAETAAETQPTEQWLHEVAERVVFPKSIQKGVYCQRLPSEESAYPFNFITNLAVKLSGYNLIYNSFKNKLNFTINHEGKTESTECLVWKDYWTEGPSDDAWTVASWTLDSTKDCFLGENETISDIKLELSGLLENFKNGLPLERPKEFLQMAELVARQLDERQKEDIEVWAERLSNDLSKLSD